jgi:hypothetical protein
MHLYIIMLTSCHLHVRYSVHVGYMRVRQPAVKRVCNTGVKMLQMNGDALI